MALGQNININFLANINNAVKDVQKLQKQTNKSLNSIGKTAKIAGAALVGIFAGRKVVDAFRSVIDESVQLENALTGLKAVAQATGNDVNSINERAKELASDGLIPLTEVSASLKNLLATGLSADQAVKTFKALRDAAAFNRQGTLSLGQAIEGATQGIKNQNSIMVDNAGITKNLSVIYKEYANSVGKTVGQLSDAEKVQAAYLGIQKEAQLFQGNYNTLLNTFSGSISKVSGNWKFLLADIGSFITKSPQVVGAVNGLGEGLKGLRKFVNENSDGIASLVANGFNFLISSSAKVIKAIVNIYEVFAQLRFLLSRVGDSIALFVTKTILKFKFLGAQIKNIFDQKALKEVEAQQRSIIKAIEDRNEKLANSDVKSTEERIKVLRGFGQKAIEISENVTNGLKSNPVVATVKVDEKAKQTLRESFGQTIRDLNKNGIGGLKLPDFAGALTGGKQGAKKLVKGLAKTAANTIVPGLGEAIGPLLDVFMEGPKQVKKMVGEFAKALPELISNIIQSIPAFLEAIAENADVVVEGLIDELPNMINALVAGLPRAAIALAKAFAIDVPLALAKNSDKIAFAFLKGIVKEFPNAIINAFKDAFSGLGNIFKALFKFDGGGKGPVEKFLGFDFPFIAFAHGGMVGNRKAGGDSLANDKVPALLSEGEIVLPRSAVNGGMGSIIPFLKDVGVPQFGFGGFVGNFFGGIGGFFESAFDRAKRLKREAEEKVIKDAFKSFELLQSIPGFDKLTEQIVPSYLREIIESLTRIGANFSLTGLIKNPLGEIKNAVSGARDYFQPSFRKLLSTPFAKGGMVPSGFNNDNFPARLSSGEFVVNNSLTPKLENFLENEGRGGGMSDKLDTNNILLGQILEVLGVPQIVETSIELNENKLAQALLEISRNNQRIA